MSVLQFNLHSPRPFCVRTTDRVAGSSSCVLVTTLRPRNHRDRARLVERARPTRYRGINQSLSILEGMPCGQIRIPTDPLRRRTAVSVNGARSVIVRRLSIG